MRNDIILLQKNEILCSKELAEAPQLHWGRHSPHGWGLNWDNMSSFGQNTLRMVWKHLIGPEGDEQEPRGRGSCF